jgi:CheY-like chemotaxis protein
MASHSDSTLIFLVEDNPVDIDLTRRAFAKNQLQVNFEVARDGEEALSFIPRWEQGELPPPCMILLDLKLPKISGLEFLRVIKNHARLSVIPIVVLTSSRELRDIEEAYHSGANSYLVKPIDFDQFLHLAADIENYWCKLNVGLVP